MTYECDADYFNLATGESTDDEYGCSWWEGDEGQKGEVAKQRHEHKEIARREREKHAQGLACAWCNSPLYGLRCFPMGGHIVCGAEYPKQPRRSEAHQSATYDGFSRIVAESFLKDIIG